MTKKYVLAFLFFSFLSLFLILPKSFASDPDFDISVASTYDVAESGTTTLTQNISITNKTEFYFTPTYTVSVGFKNIENIEAFNASGSIPTTLVDKDPNNKSIKLSFPERIAGLGKTNNFTLRFETNDVSKKQGNIWEVSIPGIATPDDFTSYTATVKVPLSFGGEKIVKPSQKLTKGNVIFTKDEIGKAGAYLLYGDNQYYSFNLKYNISNPNLFPVRTEIALPPQTNYQNIIISSFSLTPENVTRDEDGNWIAQYRLLPQQKESITVKGFAQILPLPRSEDLTKTQLNDYTSPRKYWESNDSEILKISSKLTTPQQIYDYVVKNLTYNYDKVSNDNVRLGGKGAIDDMKNSVCLEFTDLFITLARASGIPARSVEGFAYTQNTKLRPLSLVSDILHAWPEYYDQEMKKWIMVDPTWGNTTKGMDYFNTLDYEHIAFVVKGTDSEYPIPAGGYKFAKASKDVDVHFADANDFKPQSQMRITDTFPKFSFPGVTLSGSFKIQNTGNTSLENMTAKVTTEKGNVREFAIDYIPPFGYKQINLEYSDITFLTNGNYVITIQVGNTTYKKVVRISFIPDLEFLLIIGGIIGGSIIIAAVTYHTGSILVQRRKR